jgi:BirA family biotin operon repressor/biotin-[acetyl-CoA-carboxylase] ligase
MEHPVHRFDRLDSTMLKAAELAAEGAPEGTIVVADCQTSGQGRLGRSWHSEPGLGLYMTEILRPKLCPDSLPVVTLALGVAAHEAISETAGVACDLRWPNDILIGDRKCAGILAQLQDGVLLAGIGVNVNHDRFPEDIAEVATSLKAASGREHSRDALLTTLIESIDRRLEELFAQGKAGILARFSELSSYVRGRRVTVETGESQLRGTTDGLDPQGFLYLREDIGRRTLILAGGVRPECSSHST